MRTADDARRLTSLIALLLRRGYPSAVHLANEPGCPPGAAAASLLPHPRFSICLSGQASYQVVRDGRPVKITLGRGEAIAVSPECVMEPHPDGRYLALGIVFTPEMTRFLLARKSPGSHKGSHRFLLSHHSQATWDDEMAFFFRTMCRPSVRGAADPYPRKLLQLLLIKARELADAGSSDASSRKAWFTWRAACQYIHENLGRPIDRGEIAAFLQLHPNHLSRLFTRFTEGTLNQYLLDARLRLAARLLENPTLNIGQIARAAGFAEANYFIRCYRKKYGQPPGTARSTTPRPERGV